MSFGELLRKYRTAAGLSQEVLAAAAGLSVESIGAIERQVRRAPYRHTVLALAHALELGSHEHGEFTAAADRARARPRPNPSSATVPDRRLPLSLTSFVGRSDDVATITRLLGEHRLVTITGSGGVGKTRAVLEVIAGLPGDRWDDVRFVDLSPISDPRYFVGAIEPRLEAAQGDLGGGIEKLIATLRSARALIVLDTCEHLIAEVALLVSSVLTSCRDVSFLTTSRERLAITAEQVYRLPSLGVPLHAPPTIAEVRRYAGPELFVQRASNVDRSFTFGDSDVENIVAICRQLDGIPLAIELAAARAAVLGLDALRSRLRHGLAFNSSPRGVPARQQTMQATISWSFDLLTDSERMVLERLSIFVGGCTLAAAETVCASDAVAGKDIADIVSSLVDKSLVQVHSSDGGVRYGLLDSVRAFASERLARAGLSDTLSKRHAHWLADLGDRVDDNRARVPEGRSHRGSLPELDNARAALAWALNSGSEEDALLAARIIGGLRLIWLMTSRRGECRRWAEAALERIDVEKNPHVAARLFLTLTQVAQHADLVRFVEQAIPVFERIGDRIGTTILQYQLARSYRRRWMFSKARAASRRGDESLADLDVPRSIQYAVCLERRSDQRLADCEFERARADAEEVLAIYQSLGDTDPVLSRLYISEIDFFEIGAEAAIRNVEGLLERATNALDSAYVRLAYFHAAIGNVDDAYDAACRILLARQSQPIDAYDLEAILALDAVAVVAASRSRAAFAARLSAAVDHWLERSEVEIAERQGCISVVTRQVLIPLLAAQLSNEEIDRYRSAGRTMRIEDAIAEALEL